jgi:hypothetical protein
VFFTGKLFVPSTMFVGEALGRAYIGNGHATVTIVLALATLGGVTKLEMILTLLHVAVAGVNTCKHGKCT